MTAVFGILIATEVHFIHMKDGRRTVKAQSIAAAVRDPVGLRIAARRERGGVEDDIGEEGLIQSEGVNGVIGKTEGRFQAIPNRNDIERWKGESLHPDP